MVAILEGKKSGDKATMGMWFIKAYHFHMFTSLSFLLLSINSLNKNTIKHSTHFKIDGQTQRFSSLAITQKKNA